MVLLVFGVGIVSGLLNDFIVDFVGIFVVFEVVDLLSMFAISILLFRMLTDVVDVAGYSMDQEQRVDNHCGAGVSLVAGRGGTTEERERPTQPCY